MQKNYFQGLVICFLAGSIMLACGNVPAVTSTTAPIAVPTEISTKTPIPVATISMNEIGRIGKGIARQVRFSSDGSMLAVASSLGIFFYNSNGYAGSGFIETTSPVDSIAFSPDGQTLASITDDGSGQFLRIPDGKVLRSLEVKEKEHVYGGAFSPDGQLLAAVYSPTIWEAGNLTLWQVSDGKLLRTLEGDPADPDTIAFSPDGKILAAATYNSGSETGSLVLWRISDGTLFHVLDNSLTSQEFYYQKSQILAFAPDGKTLALGEKGKVTVWQISDGSLLQTLPLQFQSHASGLSFSPDGKTLACISTNGIMELWRTSDWKRSPDDRSFGPRDALLKTAFSPDLQTVITIEDFTDGVGIWQVNTGARLQKTLGGYISTGGGRSPSGSGLDQIDGIAFSPDGEVLVSGPQRVIDAPAMPGSVTTNPYGPLQLWRVKDGSYLFTLESPDLKLRILCINHPGNQAECPTSFPDSRVLAFSPDGRTLAAGTEIGVVPIWQIATGDLLTSLKSHLVINGSEIDYSPITGLIFSPDGKILASGAEDGNIKLWQVSDWTLLRTLERPGGVTRLAFSPDGAVLAAAYTDGTLRLWNVLDRNSPIDLNGQTDEITSMAFSPDGRILAASSAGGLARLWQVSDGALQQTLQVLAPRIDKLVFLPDGKTLALATGNGTVQIHQLSDGMLNQSLSCRPGRQGEVGSVAFSGDVKTLAVGLDNGSIRLCAMDK
jgi:WD40 repeat protein